MPDAVGSGVLLLGLGLDTGEALELRILDAAKAKPLAGANVVWRTDEGDKSEVAVDAQGRVGIPVPEGAPRALRVTARKVGFAP